MKKTYITTSIAYVNAEPHIGFLYELLAGDVLKRYHQSLGEEVFFVTGTDEHGIKVAQAAESAGQQPQEYVDETSKKFEALGKDFNIDFDYFIRTTNPEHIKFVKEKWQQLANVGVLKKKKYTGLYCSGCEAFKTDGETKDGKCAIHEKELEKIEEENWFLTIDDDKKKKIEAWIERSVYPETRRQEVINVLKSGAYDEVSVSRSKERYGWGVPVPGDDGQIMYVWVDALFNYISALEINGKQDLWPADIQIVGKDIVKFHAIIWPALLLSIDEYEDKLPKKLLVHGFINVDGKKMSKSLGNVIAPQQLLERYGVEASRYLLFRQLSFYDDSNFTWESFDQAYEGELSNGIGNLLNRTVNVLRRYNANEVRSRLAKCDDWFNEEDSKRDPSIRWRRFVKASVKDFDFSLIPRVISNRLWAIEEKEEKLFKSDPEPAYLQTVSLDERTTALQPWVNLDSRVLDNYFEFVVKDLLRISYFIQPLLPETASEIRSQLTELDPKPLFPRLEK